MANPCLLIATFICSSTNTQIRPHLLIVWAPMAGQPLAKQRKRDAVGNLRDIADELGMSPDTRNKADLREGEFLVLHDRVLGPAATPEQRQRVADTLGMYKGNLPATPGLPMVPPLPGSGSNAAVVHPASASSAKAEHWAPGEQGNRKREERANRENRKGQNDRTGKKRRKAKEGKVVRGRSHTSPRLRTGPQYNAN